MFLRGVDGPLGDRTEQNDKDAESRTPARTGGNPGNAVGSVQEGGIERHTHTLTAPNVWGAVNGQRGWADFTAQPDAYYSFTTDYTGGSETRPKNAYVNYVIKY
jgi:hypothetical protein